MAGAPAFLGAGFGFASARRFGITVFALLSRAVVSIALSFTHELKQHCTYLLVANIQQSSSFLNTLYSATSSVSCLGSGD